MLKASYISRVAVAVVIFLTVATASAQSSKPVLVELFTSEGCSDCPPAEAFLQALDSKQPVSGEQLIVMEEHVDYWDDQGWKDPFSSHAFTERQQGYVERLGVRQGPYTPQMVVDGEDQFVGADRSKAAKAFRAAASSNKSEIKLSAHLENGKVLAHLEVGETSSKGDVFIAIVLDHTQSQVLRGENGGRHLEHVAVVKYLEKIGKTKKGETFTKDVTVALDHPEQQYRAIVFAQQPGQGKIIGAAMSRVQ
jgi:hypothetical protein